MSKGLMRKTKQELVDIILRKDDVEVKLQQQVKACQEELEQVKQINQNYSLEIDKLEKDAKFSNIAYNTLNEDKVELSKTLAEKEEIISGLEDLVEEHQLNLIEQTKRNCFYKNWAIIATIVAISEIILLLELVF